MLLLCYTCLLCIVCAPQWAASGRAYFIRLAKIEISCRLKHRQASWDNNESGIMGSHPALGFPQQTTNQTNMHRSTLSIHVIKIFKLVSLSAIFEDLYWIFAKIFSQQNQLLSSDAQLCYAMLANQATHCTYICICIFSLICICIFICIVLTTLCMSYFVPHLYWILQHTLYFYISSVFCTEYFTVHGIYICSTLCTKCSSTHFVTDFTLQFVIQTFYNMFWGAFRNTLYFIFVLVYYSVFHCSVYDSVYYSVHYSVYCSV